MDVVYVCRPGPNEELRYSLRSLRHLPHDKVVIAGAWPDWVRGVESVPVERARSKYAQTTDNLLAALRHVGPRFYLFNDDFFVMKPTAHVPVMYRGPLREVSMAVGPDYGRRMREVADWLEGCGYGTGCYEVHAPMPLMRDALEVTLNLAVPAPGRHMHKRSIYANVVGLRSESVWVEDFKTGDAEPWPYLSTNEAVFNRKPVGDLIRKTFPDPSPYEEGA
jgi:hypothetical protein